MVGGVLELAENVFRAPVRLGFPQHVGGLSAQQRTPIYATSVGLLLYGNQQLDSGRQPEYEITDGVKGLWSRMAAWFKGNF